MMSCASRASDFDSYHAVVIFLSMNVLYIIFVQMNMTSVTYLVDNFHYLQRP
jgi:hypothetical protein